MMFWSDDDGGGGERLYDYEEYRRHWLRRAAKAPLNPFGYKSFEMLGRTVTELLLLIYAL